MNTMNHIPWLSLLAVMGCTQSLQFDAVDAGASSPDGAADLDSGTDSPSDATLPDTPIPDAGSAPSAECPCDDLCWRYPDDEIHQLEILDSGEVFFVRAGRLMQLRDSVEVEIETPVDAPRTNISIYDAGVLVVYTTAAGHESLHRWTGAGWERMPLPPGTGPVVMAKMGDRTFAVRRSDRGLYELAGERFEPVRAFANNIFFIDASPSLLVVSTSRDGQDIRHERMDQDGNWTTLPSVEATEPHFRQTAHVSGDIVIRNGVAWDGREDVRLEGVERIIASGLARGRPWILSGLRLLDISNPAAPAVVHEYNLAPNTMEFVGDAFPWAAHRRLTRFTGVEWVDETGGSERPFLTAHFDHVAGVDDDLWTASRVSPGGVVITRLHDGSIEHFVAHEARAGLRPSDIFTFAPTSAGLLVGFVNNVALFQNEILVPQELDSGAVDHALYVAQSNDEIYVAGGHGVWRYDGGGFTEVLDFGGLSAALIRDGHTGAPIESFEFAAVHPYADAGGDPAFWLLPSRDLPLIRYEAGVWTLVPLPEEAEYRSDQHFHGASGGVVLVSNDHVFEWANGSWTEATLDLGPTEVQADSFGNGRTILVSRGDDVMLVSYGLGRWTRTSAGVWTKNAMCEGVALTNRVYWPSDASGPLYFLYNATVLETRSVD